MPGKYPPLARNPSVSLPSPANLANAILLVGLAPVTGGNLQPYGMPPFGQQMTDREIAAVASYARVTWGGDPAGVSELEVQPVRRRGRGQSSPPVPGAKGFVRSPALDAGRRAKCRTQS